MKKGISVILCCYNSVQRLPETLKHLAVQKIPKELDWEVLLINNASTDNTPDFAMELWKTYSNEDSRLKVIHEEKPGQMHARKTGAENAEFNYLIFCDDDNWLQEDYLFLAFQTMEKDARIGAAGGRNFATTDAPSFPEWWETYKDKYATGIPAAVSGDISLRGFILGAGMVTRRALFLQVISEKYPSLLRGRSGAQLSTGDDFEYCKRLLLWDYSLYYEAGLQLTHFIPKQRLTIDYREKLMEGITAAGRVIHEYDLALRLYRSTKNKNRTRLWMLAPLRLYLAVHGYSKREPIDQELIQYYFSPFTGNEFSVRAFIKGFEAGKNQ